MTLCHAGTLFPQYDPGPLLAALAALFEALPEARAEIRLRLYGSHSEREAIRRFGLGDVVEEHRWLARDELVRELAASDVLVLCMSGPRGADFWVPAKTYMYLRAGKPVLALVPAGEARQILQKAGVGVVCDANDVREITDCLAQLHKSWKAGALVVQPDREFIQTFEGRRLTGALAAILDGVAGA
jgi:glycosyltransferase involved in cell wall biosynthesis